MTAFEIASSTKRLEEDAFHTGVFFRMQHVVGNFSTIHHRNTDPSAWRQHVGLLEWMLCKFEPRLLLLFLPFHFANAGKEGIQAQVVQLGGPENVVMPLAVCRNSVHFGIT